MVERHLAKVGTPDRYRLAAPIRPVSKSGDCTRLKSGGGLFESGSGHHLSDSIKISSTICCSSCSSVMEGSSAPPRGRRVNTMLTGRYGQKRTVPRKYGPGRRRHSNLASLKGRGRYPVGPPFYSPKVLRWHARLLTDAAHVRIVLGEPTRCCRLLARTPPSQGGRAGSIPASSSITHT